MHQNHLKVHILLQVCRDSKKLSLIKTSEYTNGTVTAEAVSVAFKTVHD